MKMEKDKAGYIREGKFRSSEESILEAQGLTFNLSAMCNLEDSGDWFGPESKTSPAPIVNGSTLRNSTSTINND